MTTTVVSHAHCPDGHTAAWIAWHYFTDRGEEVVLHPGVYGSPDAPQPPPDCTGHDVVILDFSYPPAELVALCERAETVTWLDHHASAIDAWRRHLEVGGAWPMNLKADLDLHRSGALITWDHYTGAWWPNLGNPSTRSPGDAHEMCKIIERIDARDRWQKNPDGTWALDGTAEVFAALTSRPYTIEAWDEAFALGLDGLIAQGRPAEQFRQQIITSAVAFASQTTVAGHTIHVANVPYSIGSDVAERLNLMHPDEPFSGYWFTDGSEQKWGLRSRPDGADVAAVAALFGGGGHTHAAGFRIPDGALGDGLNPLDLDEIAEPS